MTTPEMNCSVKAMRRGGWSARAIIVTVQHGQLFETQVGPRQFPAREAAFDWLQQAAAERSIAPDRVVVETAASFT